MSSIQQVPFSLRNKRAPRQIDGAFPQSARIGLLHLMLDLVERDFVSGWPSMARELQRIARIPPTAYDKHKIGSLQQAKSDAKAALDGLSWDKVYDFCERLHGFLAQEVGYETNYDYEVVTARPEVQSFIEQEIQRLFSEEDLAFEFSEGLVRRRGRKHTTEVATRAQVVLGDLRLDSARKHYDKALVFFRNRSNPDFENCVKEAVCSVEAAGKALFPSSKASTLGELANWFKITKEVTIPKSLVQTITGVYAFRSGGDGIGHGGASGGTATREVAEYVLGVCASQIIFLVDVASSRENDLPF